jgi:hypothetical protein
MDTTRRTAGLGLVAYGLGTAVAFMSTGSPGGSYEESKVVAYMDSGHWPVAALLGYLGAFAAVGLLVFANRMRHELGARGDLFWALCVAASASAVVGWFLIAGISVAFGEGGSALAAIPHPVVYLISELSNLVTVCSSAFFVGAAAIVLASKAALPTALRVTTYVAGVCGIFAAFFFPVFLFWLWAIGFGTWMTVSDRDTARVPEPQLA